MAGPSCADAAPNGIRHQVLREVRISGISPQQRRLRLRQIRYGSSVMEARRAYPPAIHSAEPLGPRRLSTPADRIHVLVTAALRVPAVLFH
jgi:hypothetical protein